MVSCWSFDFCINMQKQPLSLFIHEKIPLARFSSAVYNTVMYFRMSKTVWMEDQRSQGG